MILILPKIMGVEDYGGWQLYVFYLSYVGFFHFGWPDGVYLRYGGEDYDALQKSVFSGQFYALAVVEICIATIFVLIAKFLATGEFAKNVLQMVSVVGVLVILTTFINFVLQFTNRIKSYAKLIFYERMLFFIATLSYLALGNTSYEGMLWISFGTNLLALFYGGLLIKEIITCEIDALSNILKEASANICVGSKLMIANVAGMLQLGIIRLGISSQWDVATFGKVSLTLSISSFLMVFIGSVSVVLFPILKQIQESKLPGIYIVLRNCLSVVLLGLLTVYYPLKAGLSIWLPKYADSLSYMAVLFPICLFDGKITLLINTYLKSLRQERLMLRVNSMAVVVSLLSTLITVFWLHDLNLTVMSIVAVFAFRCVLAEYFLGILLNLDLRKEILLELAMVVGFIGFSWCVDGWWSVALYMIVYIVYLWMKRDDLHRSVFLIREYVGK